MTTTIGSIATYLVTSFSNLPTGVSGTMTQIVDYQRMYLEQYTGYSIGSNAIDDKYTNIIVNLSMANLMNLKLANGDGSSLTLSELSQDDKGALLSADQYMKLAEMGLKAIPRAVGFVRSLSS